MGGDHKCPVCQATFTRPQHVARHMRSHTGDRPYKCQYCGDQFARSDLLARHINKCHANEKPLPNTTTTGRRKGSAAASRATTSKQACDQCVQSSLPCDGSNPCSKCLARKCRCTYVKFHRQTAPTGPGHHPPRSPSSSSSSSLSGSAGPSRLPSHLDTFVLVPPLSAPPMPPVPFTASDQIFNTPFTFNPAAPAYPCNWTTADVVQLPLSVASEPDMTTKYRAQTDFLRRPGHPIFPNNSPTLLPGLYGTNQYQSPSSSLYPAWGESGTYHPPDDTKPFDAIARAHSFTSSEPTSFAPDLYGVGFIGSAYRPRRASLDFSDSSSATSQSIPSSAASSSLHLPLPGNDMCEKRSEEMQSHASQHQRSNSLSMSQLPPPQQPHRVGEGGFSSAFGLMSIDDPNALAGLPSDGVPFFSNLGVGILPHSPNATPMPTCVHHPHPQQNRDRGMSLGALPTPGLTKDGVDARELKDLWKTYLRSPLSGSGMAALDPSTSQPLPLAQMPQSPPGQRRRKRVSSLPSVTPTVEKGHPLMINGVGHGEAGAGAMRSTVNGNPEDLRSYEAAVNARSAPLKLNLIPRRKGTRPSLNGSEIVGPPSSSSVATGQADHQGISRPSSSSSTSSLAQAFTLPSICSQPPPPYPQNHAHNYPSHTHLPVPGVVKPPPMQGASISLPIPPSMSGLHSSSPSHPYGYGHGYGHAHPHSVALASSISLTFEPGSRASSVTSDGTGTGGSGSDGEAFRPSFKRYPSQTLVPESSKRVLVERRGGESKGVKVDKGLKREDCDERKEETDGEIFERVGASVGSPRSRPIAALPERAKRG